MEKRGFSEVNDGEFLPRSKELYIYFIGYLSIGLLALLSNAQIPE